MSLELTVCLIIFLTSFLGGVARGQQPKFSSNWFLGFYIPLFILFFIGFTKHLLLGWYFINFVLFYYGQKLGERLSKKSLTVEEIEKLEQIGDLQLPRQLPADLKDEDVAIVLMNMGGPINQEEIEPFLRRLFNDALIIRFPFAQSFFAEILIKARLKGVKKNYQLIGGGSPLLASSLLQLEALQQELKKRGRSSLKVFLSFNYSDPLPDKTIAEIKASQRRTILPLGLYPHFSLSTTASNIFYLKRESEANFPQARFLQSYSYHLYDGYVEAFIDRIQQTVSSTEKLDDFYLLFSAHGTPLYFVKEGDPYSYLVSQTISKIVSRLNRQHQWSISYQSAVGPLMWLKPSTDATLAALAHRGVKKIIVVPISFVTDHIETLCEIDIEYRHLATHEGITDYRMSKALECHPAFISALADCVENSLK
jgi:ferrochelatase